MQSGNTLWSQLSLFWFTYFVGTHIDIAIDYSLAHCTKLINGRFTIYEWISTNILNFGGSNLLKNCLALCWASTTFHQERRSFVQKGYEYLCKLNSTVLQATLLRLALISATSSCIVVCANCIPVMPCYWNTTKQLCCSMDGLLSNRVWLKSNNVFDVHRKNNYR